VVRMKQFRIALAGCGFFMLSAFIVYVFRPGGDPVNVIFGNIVSVAAALIAVLALIWLLLNMRDLELSDAHNKWLFFALGMLLYFLGETTWMIYEAILGLDPYPSIADVFWLMGYLPLFVGLIYTIRETRVSFWSSKTPLLCVITGGLAAVFYIYLLRPILADTGTLLIERLVSCAYPVLDLFLIVLTVTILVFYHKGMLGKPWLFVLSGFVLFGIADGLFSYFSWTGAYYELPYYDLIDLLWLGGYWLIALGAIYERSFQDHYIRAERRTKVTGRMVANHKA
jgi:hypothetical protein